MMESGDIRLTTICRKQGSGGHPPAKEQEGVTSVSKTRGKSVITNFQAIGVGVQWGGGGVVCVCVCLTTFILIYCSKQGSNDLQKWEIW